MNPYPYDSHYDISKMLFNLIPQQWKLLPQLPA
jgi:hypothetical protein